MVVVVDCDLLPGKDLPVGDQSDNHAVPEHSHKVISSQLSPLTADGPCGPRSCLVKRNGLPCEPGCCSTGQVLAVKYISGIMISLLGLRPKASAKKRRNHKVGFVFKRHNYYPTKIL